LCVPGRTGQAQPVAIVVRALSPQDWKVCRDLRLAALRDSPDAFYSTYEENRDRDEAAWRAWPSRGVACGAWLGGVPVGMVGIATDPDADGEADLFAMWVAPAARGSGVADALIRAALEWAAAAGARGVNLEVAPGNARAERVYARHGFVGTAQPAMIEHGLVLRFRIVTSDAGVDQDLEDGG
jgi:ribosomal protein S18 acetylase RimI-like enzyme